MISLVELNKHGYSTSPEIVENLKILLGRINQVRAAYGVPMVVTSGLRSPEKQQELIQNGESNAPHSNHLLGLAVDILDTDGALHNWTKQNEVLMETIGFWMEERQGPWQHYQCVPPLSNKRWFNP